jgi:hypothetical protein
MTDVGIPPPAQQSSVRPRHGPRLKLIELLVILSLMAAAISYFQSPLNDRRDDCQRRMQQLAAATLHYAIEHGGYPDDPKVCQELRRLSSRNLICPNSSLESDPPHAAEIGGALDARESVSYIYVGRGVKDTHASNMIIWLEPKTNHSEPGMNVTLADGAVQWMDSEDADRILAQVAAGTRPVTIQIENATRP